MIDKGQWREYSQDTGVTPLLFTSFSFKFYLSHTRLYRDCITMSVMGFLVTTESQDLGLTSHPKDGAFLTV